MNKWLKILAIGTPVLIVALFIGAHLFIRSQTPPIPLPEFDDVPVTWASGQNWTPAEWQWFYHTPQGGSFELPIPYEWMINFEQPKIPFLILTEVERLMDPTYMSRLGFLANPVESYDPDDVSLDWVDTGGLSEIRADANNNPDQLPVGFTRTRGWIDYAGDRAVRDVIGFNCAACHTGQLNFRGQGIRIDGGPALTDLGKFRLASGYAMGLTLKLPTRFNRFANNVLGEGHTEEQSNELKAEMEILINKGLELKDIITERGIYPTEEGFGRLDAIGRIFNFVVGNEINYDNLRVGNAPVNFPHIWDTPWFDWVQYNASFGQAMLRNAGEAMGVFATVDFKSFGDEERLFQSNINVVNLHEMESLIRGAAPYQGLRSPEWPEDILGTIDRQLASEGEELYRQNCAYCHLPPMTDSAAFMSDGHWPADSLGNRYMKVTPVNLWDIGTDPGQATNFIARTVELGKLGYEFHDHDAVGGLTMGGTVTGGVELPWLVEQAAIKRYQDIGLPDSLWTVFDGERPWQIQAALIYKARPLNGVWATPPFLHNGSVPSVYLLLGPPEERPDTFWLGTKEYDPVNLGYVWEARIDGGFEFDASITGNSNMGHRFEGSADSLAADYFLQGEKGAIGPTLSHDDRMAIIEYLKTIPGAPSQSSGN